MYRTEETIGGKIVVIKLSETNLISNVKSFAPNELKTFR